MTEEQSVQECHAMKLISSTYARVQNIFILTAFFHGIFVVSQSLYLFYIQQ